MGLGFVLLIWIIFFGCAGLPVAGGLAYWSWRNGRRAHSPSKWRAAAAGLLPFVLIVVGMVWFAGYAVYSEVARKVDPWLGDSLAVPLRHGYFFCMIDVTDQGYLMKDGCSGLPAVHDIRELAEVGDAIVGSSGQLGAFVFDTTTGELKTHPDTSTALAQFSPAPTLQSANKFYGSRRFGWQDTVAFLILVLLVVAVSWLWFRLLIRVRVPAATRS
jgi:hypothetical protein